MEQLSRWSVRWTLFLYTAQRQKVRFPAKYVLGRKGGCYVSAIELWSATMLRLDPGPLKAVALRDGHQGLVIVDDRRDCTNNTGDVAQTGLSEIKLRKWARFWTDSERLQEAV